jgi:hypothetical protein
MLFLPNVSLPCQCTGSGPDDALIQACASISATHQRATGLLGNTLAEVDANSREIRELGGEIDADVQRVIECQTIEARKVAQLVMRV